MNIKTLPFLCLLLGFTTAYDLQARNNVQTIKTKLKHSIQNITQGIDRSVSMINSIKSNSLISTALPNEVLTALEEAVQKSGTGKNIAKSLQAKLEKAGDNKDEILEIVATLLDLADTSFTTVANVAERMIDHIVPDFLQED